MKLASAFRILAAVIVICSAFAIGTTLSVNLGSKKQVFRVFSDLGQQTFIADRVEQRGACSVFITGGKEAAFLCFPHMIVPMGSEQATPKSGEAP